MKDKYKHIKFSFYGLIAEEARNIIDRNFDRNDLFLEKTDSGYDLYLKQIDIRTLKALSYNSVIEKICGKIESIKSYTIKNGKRQYIDYNAERKVVDRRSKEASRNKFYYASDNTFTKNDNILPAKYENKIICGDSLEILKRLPANCVDMIVTSPPYNFGLAYDDHDDTSFWQDYYQKLYAIFDECIRVLKYGGRIFVNVQPLYSDYIPTHHIISNYFLQKKLIWKAEIIWEKNNYNCKYCSWGSWKSPASPYMKYTWEFIEVFCKGNLKKEGDKSKIDIEAEEFKSWVVAKWSIAPERKMKEYGHPAMFPEALVERALKLYSYKDDVILDPFNGAGTTTFVAHKLNRRYLGIDISEAYCETAKARIRKTPQGNTLFE